MIILFPFKIENYKYPLKKLIINARFTNKK
jgi:hypothetical protein